ncbi:MULTISPECIES: YidB family protein [unclassified Devosia]|jgi:uncharacterized protein YidB (DUF937 family)|uniref:YidB family protein n=1 Tax=unclassified Devosia TaxID=196773 RepID=UPI0008684D2B|nr:MULTISPECIES: YidB family protein [unclassified Devosia]MBN9361228.1 DUF937 domain-containing protein [Devosia sp.]ODS83100.1 MAG: hypothetical protein ABS47_21455 [Devosia sp. SCN 66-27]OJX26322.1 MAG: hypothetical protein BGO83_20680 [Devosia sp. 66-14]
MSLFSDLGGMVENAIAQQGGVNAIFTQALSGMGGYDGILAKLNQAGLGNVVNSWVGTGKNLPISPEQIQAALGDQHLRQLAAQFGVPIDQISALLAQHLPNAVDQASPNGTLAPSAPKTA